MLSHWPIRYKLLFGAAMLCLIVAFLSFSSFRGVYAYRQLVRGISRRANEMPPAADLATQVRALSFTLGHGEPLSGFSSEPNTMLAQQEFQVNLTAVERALNNYRAALKIGDAGGPFIGDKRREWETVHKIRSCLDRIKSLNDRQDWVLNTPTRGSELSGEVDRLSNLTDELPNFLQNKMRKFHQEVRGQYHIWIGLTWTSTILTAIVVVMLVRLFYVWVFGPLRTLVDGSRCVAAGNFDHRIHLKSHDEVAELAAAMNAMTSRFQQIRDDLDRQVAQRTREVVRSEQLASVGFLAAGVAHEINNPLASIAWSAESLESRLHETLHADQDKEESLQDPKIGLLRKYLQRIQDEAFRCKGITERLLDFSRIGETSRQNTDLRELVQVVIDMVRHLGKYRGKQIEFTCDQHVVIPVNAQEIKQVVLNLITNALDSLETHGTVRVQLRRTHENAELTVTDDGVGMTDEVLTHLFEPFFTRKRGGHGTGLGLSITYQIISDHDGRIEVTSDGPGKGSQFKVALPLVQHEKENQRDQHAA